VLINDVQLDNLKQAHELAYHNACADFCRWDPLDMAASSGSHFAIATQTFSLMYINEEYRISFPAGEVLYAAKSEAVPTTVKIILLHYLIRASGQSLRSQWISFREIPEGGLIYFQPFNNRVIHYLLSVFTRKPAMLLQAGAALGGTEFMCGDYGVQMNVLPRLPVVFGLWSGDEEFSPRATVLFDVTAPLYLPTEDLVVATAFCVGKLAKLGKTLAEQQKLADSQR
jgi:hypothetical protein